MTTTPSTVPYTGALVHYVSNHGVAEQPVCIAGIVTEVTAGPAAVTATLFFKQGVPAPGVYATYDANPAQDARAAGTWHWPADDDPGV